ncbi:peptidoglycan/LPS O-acetylase OafA/YrhL [Pedobacter sp. CG_S7]|uniref:acyltransferase family protein n=1 Tax=Pedobacter sp. CG_S7 TaxID=3143930 RepID=UPI00339B80E2
MNETRVSSNILKTKQHFEILDGLRGLAAVAVVIFHFMEWAYSDLSKNFIGHGFLAVDFFFCLSGFVIGYAYDDRISKMGIMRFLKSRFIRLHPLIVLGSILGLLTFLLDPFGNYSELYSLGRTLLIFVTSIFLIPFPVMQERAFNLFSFNAPAWSLFWEYVANIFYAFILFRISRKALLLLILLAAATLCFVSYSAGNLIGGWDKSSFWHGGARIFYSFLAGLAIYRFNWIIKNKIGFIGMCALLSLAFLMPFGKWNWLTEPAVVLFYFPFLIALGAGATLTKGLKNLCTFSGKISYPLYMTHYAVLWMFGNYYTNHQPSVGQLTFIIIGSLILLMGFAYLVMVFYDIPVRKYLNNKMKAQITKK